MNDRMISVGCPSCSYEWLIPKTVAVSLTEPKTVTCDCGFRFDVIFEYRTVIKKHKGVI